MNPFIREITAQKDLADAFLKRHNNDLSGLTPASLQKSDHETDRRIYESFCNEPGWEEKLQALANFQIPSRWRSQPSSAPAPGRSYPGQIQIMAQPKNFSSRKNSAAGNSTPEWYFQCPINYFLGLFPYAKGSNQSLIERQAYAIVDNQLPTQPDGFDSDPIAYTLEMPKVDAITGSFDTDNSNDLMFYQINDTLFLDEINVSSVKEYKNLYTEKTSFFTKSQACDLLKIPGKQQIVTVSLNATQIKVDVYYFTGGRKVEWASSSLFDYSIIKNPDAVYDYELTNIAAFNISVSEVLPDQTVEVAVIVSRSDNKVSYFRTDLFKFVFNISSSAFSWDGKQMLSEFVYLLNNSLYTSMVNCIYQSNGFLYLNYSSDCLTLTVAALQWNDGSSSYQQIWKEDYKMASKTLLGLYIYQPPLLYQNGDTFYFVHVYQDFNSDYWPSWPVSIEIYQRQNDGTLCKQRTITSDNDINLDCYGNYWNGLYMQGSFYLVRTTDIMNEDNDNESPAIIFYQVDENAGKLVQLAKQFPSSPDFQAYGMPILALSNYDIESGTPSIQTVDGNVQFIAILDAPPTSTLLEYPDGFPSFTFTFQDQQTSFQNVETKTETSQSDTLQGGLKFFGQQIGETITQKMTESADQSHQTKFQLTQNTQILTQQQDMTLYMGTTYDLYQYPMTIAGVPSGYFLFLVPTTPPHVTSSTGQLMFRKTSHQIGNLLSYPTQMPSDIQQQLYTCELSINANQAPKFTVTYDELQTDTETTTTTTTVNTSTSIGLEFPIIKNVASSISGKEDDSYTETNIDICSFTIENTFSLIVQIPQLADDEANKYFSIEPYFYIDQTNLLRCAYQVNVSAGGPADPTYWGKYYTYPDFGMVMPFHTDAFKDDSKYLLSFDIETNPSELVADLTELDISVTVHNWSLVAGNNVTVAFYYGTEFKVNYSWEQLQKDLIDKVAFEIGRTTIDAIMPRGSQTASVAWENPQLILPINAVPIYVMIDPDNEQQEMEQDNNFAQIVYPLSSIQP